MITPETPPPMPLPAKAISSAQHDELLDPALCDLMKQDQWIDEFIERLDYTIKGIVRKK